LICGSNKKKKTGNVGNSRQTEHAGGFGRLKEGVEGEKTGRIHLLFSIEDAREAPRGYKRTESR